MEIKFNVDSRETQETLSGLTPRQYAQQKARAVIGGGFGDEIARGSIQIDDNDPLRHEIYAGGKNGYIAEHIHTGGTVRPKNRKYLGIPLGEQLRGLYPREVQGLFCLKSKKGNLLLFRRPKKRAYLEAPVYLLKESVTHKPRPWWPDDVEVQTETIKVFRDIL